MTETNPHKGAITQGLAAGVPNRGITLSVGETRRSTASTSSPSHSSVMDSARWTNRLGSALEGAGVEWQYHSVPTPSKTVLSSSGRTRSPCSRC